MEREISSRKKGAEIEAAVTRYLAKNGYAIIETNYFSNFGEIDIIAKEKKTLVFVEVKAKSRESGMNPLEAITPKKMRRIIQSAKEYMMMKNISRVYVRFDVAGVITSGGMPEKIEIIKDAFQDGAL
ncbi:MAG TPA: YraN family protein [bacterium]|nr:YraN family protein [bacterium]